MTSDCVCIEGTCTTCHGTTAGCGDCDYSGKCDCGAGYEASGTDLTLSVEAKVKPVLCVLSYTYRKKHATANDKRHEWISAEAFVGGTSKDMDAAVRRIESELHPNYEMTNVMLTVVKESTLAELREARGD